MKNLLNTLALLLLVSTSSVYATTVSWTINSGGYGYETSWNISQLTGSGSFSEGAATGTMVSYQEYSFLWDLNAGDYLLTMNDTYGDGLDAGGYAELIVNGLTLLDCGSCFSSSYRLEFEVPESQTPPNAVPLPAAVWLFGSAIVGFAGFSRYKKKA